jgi:hypothetical protein
VHLLVPCKWGPGPENATQFLPIPENVTTVKTASDHFKFLVGFSGGVILRTHAISSEDSWKIGSGSGKNDIRILLMRWKVSNEKVPAHPTHEAVDGEHSQTFGRVITASIPKTGVAEFFSKCTTPAFH